MIQVCGNFCRAQVYIINTRPAEIDGEYRVAHLGAVLVRDKVCAEVDPTPDTINTDQKSADSKP